MTDTTQNFGRIDTDAKVDGSYFDWAAIAGGAVVAAAIAVLFTGFGGALGLTTVSADAGADSGSLPLIVIGAWLLLSTIASYMAGGYVAGRMRRRVEAATEDEVSARDGLHDAVVWALGLLLSFWLAAGIVGSATNAAGNAAQATVGALGSAAEGLASGAGAAGDDLADMAGNPLDLINARLLRGTGLSIDENPELPEGGMTILRDVVRTGEIDANDRTYLAEAIATNSSLSQQQAESRVDQAVAQVVDLREAAEQRAEALAQDARDAAEAARRAAILSGFAVTAALLLAAAAAIWGAVQGGRHREDGRLFGGFRSF